MTEEELNYQQLVLSNDTQINNILPRAIDYLTTQWNGNEFSKRSFYGETFFALTLALLNQEPTKQQELLLAYEQKDWSNLLPHDEFNLFALSRIREISGKKQLAHKGIHCRTLFLRKVSNWIFLRSLLRLREGTLIQRFIAKAQISIVYTVNNYNEYITDNTLRMFYTRKNSISSQYHAFATLLLGLIAKQTDNKRYHKKFARAINTIEKEILEHNGNTNTIGRGKKQLFGYAASAYALILANHLFNQPRFLEYSYVILKHIHTFQKENGSLPLVLTNDKEEAKTLLHSYNNIFDYLPFSLWCLAESKKLLQKN